MVKIYNQDNRILARNRFCHAWLYSDVSQTTQRIELDWLWTEGGGFLDCRFSTLSRQPPIKRIQLCAKKKYKTERKGELLIENARRGRWRFTDRPVSRKLPFCWFFKPTDLGGFIGWNERRWASRGVAPMTMTIYDLQLFQDFIHKVCIFNHPMQ